MQNKLPLMINKLMNDSLVLCPFEKVSLAEWNQLDETKKKYIISP